MLFPRWVKSWVLPLFAALSLSACLSEAAPTLSAPDAREQAQAGAITLIDIRTPAEWRQTGVAQGAVRIDMRNPKGPQGFVDAVLAQVQGDRNAPIALICRTGNRSNSMQKVLQEQGFTRVYNVTEGMAGSSAGPGWIKRGLPIEACKQC
jgi:rhodanese-related sulfurtransferase